MTEIKRPRGRPRGSGGHNDKPTLERVANKLVTNPALKASTAMKQIIAEQPASPYDSTTLRRLQGKWKKQEPALMDAARKRAAPAPRPQAAGRSYASIQSAYDRLVRDQLMLKKYSEPALEYAVREQQRILDIIDPPWMRAIRQQEQMMRDIIDPPYMRAIREMNQQLQMLVDPGAPFRF